MTAVAPPVASPPSALRQIVSHPSGSPVRDVAIDAVRALCVLGVVVLHALMVGVTVTDQGPLFENAADTGWWIVPVSWLLQVMPLFFIVGGFAGLVSYRRHRERGLSATAFVTGRIHRLLRPAVIAIGAAGSLLALLLLSGVPAELVATAGFRYAQPLWFLAVFLGCQALLPAMAALHRRAPVSTLGALVAGAIGVDVARGISGVDALGVVNLAFVWLALLQLGFFLADGLVDRPSRRVRGLVLTVAASALLLGFATGVYSPDLIANINPPTTALLLVGVVHLCAFSLLRDRIALESSRPPVAAVVRFVNARTMSIYLWHMPVLLVMAGTAALCAVMTGMSLPEPAGVEWWLQRPLWLAIALGLTAVVARLLSRFESVRALPGAPRPGRVTAAAVVGTVSVVLLLVAGTSPLTAAVSVAGILLALCLAAVRTPSAVTAPVQREAGSAA